MLRVLPALLVLGFAIYCVLDVARSADTDVRGLPRPLWLLLVVVLPVVGGIAWLVGGRPRGGHRPSRPRTGGAAGPPRVLGPDDDPDFLRGLRDTPGERPEGRAGRPGERDEGTGAAGDDRPR